MIKLYRGLIDILILCSRNMDEQFTKHIRKQSSEDRGEFGVGGFWNLLLEVTLLLFIKLFIAMGVVLTVSLAIIFFPLYALKQSVVNILNHRATPFEEPTFTEPK
jgi:hypothetical protein